MKNMDYNAITKYNIPGVDLMERASEAVFKRVITICEENSFKSAVVVCGTGNNGGDGFAVARMLDTYGIEVKIITVGNTEKIKGDALINFERAKQYGIEITSDSGSLNKCNLIIDAIFGTGFKGKPREEFAEVIEKINSAQKYVVSIDIPSGINADNGKAEGACVKANETVSFVMAKTGMLLYPAAMYCGKITVTDIGMPTELTENHIAPVCYLTHIEAKMLLPERKADGHKGSFGKVFVLAGSETMMGAAYFASEAAYRTGCGLVYSCVPEEKVTYMQTMLPEAVVKPLKSHIGQFCAESYKDIKKDITSAKAVILGPGIGKGKVVTEFVDTVIRNCDRHLVIDADGLNAIATDIKMLENIKVPSVITPHVMEMSRLTDLSIEEIKDNLIGCAKAFAKEHNVVVVLKDARTVIAAPDGRAYINLTGNTALSKGGSGDVLTGIIAGLIAQGMEVFEASVLGAYIHGLSGEKAAEKYTQYSVLARDIISFIPESIKTMV